MKYVGFDSGEKHRVRQLEGNCYPLFEWGFDRKKCVEIISEAGLKQPLKSSCFFCPSMKKNEILALPENLRKRVVRIETNAKENLMEVEGLGRQFAWKDLFHADKTQLKMFDDYSYIETPCNCRI